MKIEIIDHGIHIQHEGVHWNCITEDEAVNVLDELFYNYPETVREAGIGATSQGAANDRYCPL
jgi:hypothetical protein